MMHPRIWSLVLHKKQRNNDYEETEFEITDGNISIYSIDEDKEALNDVVHALNCSDCSFYTKDWLEIENKMLRDDVEYMRETIHRLRQDRSEQI